MPPEKHDVDELIAALETPAAPPDPPAWPEEEAAEQGAPVVRGPWSIRKRTVATVAALAAAGVAALLVLPPFAERDETIGFRGDGETAPVEVELKLAVEREGRAERVDESTTLKVGERVFFRVGTSRDAEVELIAVTPEGEEDLGRFESVTVPADVRTVGGLLAYEFEVPGTYAFHACGPAPKCATVVVEVEEQ